MRARARDLLAEVDLDLAPETPVERLSPGERQLVEVAKALQLDAAIIIFDEPTTSLTARETERLFGLIERLRQSGKSMIYISHILGDVTRVADDIAVLRDGELTAFGPGREFDIGRMITLMIGRAIEQLYPERTSAPQPDILLATSDLSAKGVVKDINLALHRGEVLGLFGLMGSGRTELARILFGLDNFDSGEIRLGGEPVQRSSPRRSIGRGVAFITENRREEGLLMNMQIAENITLAALPRFGVTPLQFIEQAASRRGRHRSRGPSRDQGRLDIAAGQEPVGRQPAEGGARQMAAVGAGRLPDGRADARHRRGGKARNLFDHRPPRRRWRRRAVHLLRDRGTACHVRPHAGDEPRRDRR